MAPWVIELTVKKSFLNLPDERSESQRKNAEIFYKAPGSEWRESLLSFPSDAGGCIKFLRSINFIQCRV